MPKRRHQETDEERWLRKKKKYEFKLRKGRKNQIIYRDEEEEPIEENQGTELYSDLEDRAIAASDPDLAADTLVPDKLSPAEPHMPTEPAEAMEPTMLEPAIALGNATHLDVDPELLKALGNRGRNNGMG